LYANTNGKDYLLSTLSAPIQKVLTMGSMEVDPVRLPGDANGAAEVDANMNKLVMAAKIMLDAITESSSACPVGLKKLCFIIQRQVEQKFKMRSATALTPSDRRTSEQVGQKRELNVAVTGFIFLRFIVPAIVAPSAYGLLAPSQLQEHQKRSLVLIGKIIQNIANGVRFGGKEAFMVPANRFLEEHETSVNIYCNQLQHIDTDTVYWASDSDDGVGDRRLRGADMHASLVQIMSSFNAQMNKIVDQIATLQVAEVMTYTIFGALRSMIKRFEILEGRTQTLSDVVVARLEVDSDDDAILNNPVVLGGLEELLLMNRCVIIRGLLYPSNYSMDYGIAGALICCKHANSDRSCLVAKRRRGKRNRRPDTCRRSSSRTPWKSPAIANCRVGRRRGNFTPRIAKDQ
jgi:hypothetical protein